MMTHDYLKTHEVEITNSASPNVCLQCTDRGW